MTAAVNVSPIDAAQQAFQHMRRQLFPFRFERWLTLGVAAFLDQCGRTQTGFSTGFPGGPSGHGGGGEHSPGQVLSEAAAWLGAHVMLVMAVAAVVLVLIGMAAALAAPVLLRMSPGRSGFEELLATGREAAIRRGQVLYLRVGSSGQWVLETANAPTTDSLASGRVEWTGGPLTLMLSPTGSCMPDVATVSRGASIRLDPFSCEVQPPTPRRDGRAGSS